MLKFLTRLVRRLSIWMQQFSIHDLNIRIKMQLAMLAVALMAVGLVGGQGFYSERQTLERLAYDKLSAILQAKKAQIEHFFNNGMAQTITYSEDWMVVDAMREFKVAFQQWHYNYSEEQTSQMGKKLKRYYRTSFMPRYNINLLKPSSVGRFWPNDTKSIVSQYLYIANNMNDIGSKDLLDNAYDGSVFSDVHTKYHPVLRSFVKQFGFHDLFLIDSETGHIVYSVRKEMDFGTSVHDGPYKESGLAKAFLATQSTSSKKKVKVVDFELYAPSHSQPMAFLASPIYDGMDKIGVLVFQISTEPINQIMTGGFSWENFGMGRTGETVLFADDYLMRSISRPFFERSKSFMGSLQVELSPEQELKMEKLETTVLLLNMESNLTKKAIQGQHGHGPVVGALGQNQLCAYAPLDIKGLGWGVMSKIDEDEVLEPVNQLIWRVSLSVLLLLLITLLLAGLFGNALTLRIKRLRAAIKTLTNGESLGALEAKRRDELGLTIEELNLLSARMDTASGFAEQMGKGNFEAAIEIYSEKDKLGLSLQQMKSSLEAARNDEIKRQNEDEIRNWANTGISLFAEILRNNNNDLRKLSYEIIKHLVEYLEANQAGVFVVQNEADPANLSFDLMACYAYNRQKFDKKTVMPGDGLVGMCAIEKKTLRINDKLPDHYLALTSGLGEATPRSLTIVPAKLDKKVFAILEIASFKPFKDYQVAFVEKVSESIAATIASVKINERTAQLLKDSQDRSSEMASQEEEMRQNMEEQLATQEELERKSGQLVHIQEEASKVIQGLRLQLKDLKQEYKDLEERHARNIQEKDARIKQLVKRLGTGGSETPESPS